MNEPHHPGRRSPSEADTGGQLEALAEQFREKWERGDRPRIEDFLEQADASLRSRLLARLIQLEIELEQSDGSTPESAAYRQRFPDDGDVIDATWHKSVRGPQDITTSGLDGAHDTGLEKSSHRGSVPERIGRFRVERCLGQGGFAVVYLAYDEDLARQVALKVPRPDRFAGEEDIKRFVQEARHAAALDHPGIVPVYDVQRDVESVCIVQKYIEGRDLATQVNRRGSDPRETVRLLIDVANAVGHAHQSGLFHRDLKCANVLVDENGQPFVADFGLAVHVSRQHEHRGELAGSTPYMAPEQVRGEVHRIDGRTDIWALGVMLYELLTGTRPFQGSDGRQLFDDIEHRDPRPPRQVNPAVDRELARICMVCLSKRAADRYPSTSDLIEDLEHWLQADPGSGSETAKHVQVDPPETMVRMVPKGLRSFNSDDADFFLNLVPGPRGRDGLPRSVQFWKAFAESTPPERSGAVGLLYGPSGCGKTSLVNAGLLPHLADHVHAVYLEATPHDTEAQLASALRRRCRRELPANASLADLIVCLREDGPRNGKKILIILDQFEQWLQAHDAESGEPLTLALRQCDGSQVQCLLMVRDDFWMSITRFMLALEIPLLEGRNSSAVDLFDPDHARRVLTAFGRAFGRLPDDELTPEQTTFVNEAVAGLVEGDTVISVRLAVFAEMMRGRTWTPAGLKEVGGTEGVGVTFLEETFASRTAPPHYRAHETGIRAILRALLPSPDSDIRGTIRSEQQLREVLQREGHTAEFDTLIAILDGDTRLITPTERAADSAGDAGQHYQLTHDYLVRALREWLSRKQRETRRGRAELQLAERAALWSRKPENRHLPSLLEYGNIRLLVRKERWSNAEVRMMGRAGRLHAIRVGLALALAAVLISGGIALRQRAQARDRERLANRLVEQVVTADISNVEGLLADMEPVRNLAEPLLEIRLQSLDDEDPRKWNVALAMLKSDPEPQWMYLREHLPAWLPVRVAVARRLLAESGAAEAAAEGLWSDLDVMPVDDEAVLPFAAMLAELDPDSDRWVQVGGKLSEALVRADAVYLGGWLEMLRKQRAAMLPMLSAIYADRSEDRTASQRERATTILRQLAFDRPALLAELLLEGDESQYRVLFPIAAGPENAATVTDRLLEELEQEAAYDWNDEPLDPAWTEPPAEIGAVLQVAGGKLDVDQRWAYCLAMPWQQFTEVSERLRPTGFRPTRVRPYQKEEDLAVAAVWRRDGGSWNLDVDLSGDHFSTTGEVPGGGEGLVPVDVAAYHRPGEESEAPAYTLLWGPPAANDERRVVRVGLREEDLVEAFRAEMASGRPSMQALHVQMDGEGQPRYAAIWSDDGPPSFYVTEYPGTESVDQPHADIAFALANSNGDGSMDYATVLDASVERESRLVSRISLEEHEGAARDLAASGYRPVGITAGEGATSETDNRSIQVASVWVRPVIPDEDKEQLARRQAQAAVTLLRLGRADEVWPLLHHTPDPRLRSFLIHRLPSLGADPQVLWRRLQTESDVSVRRALLLTLAEFAEEDQLDPDFQQEMGTEILTIFRDDPDPGIHAAAEWSLRMMDRLDDMDEVRAALASSTVTGKRRWYITPTNQHTMVVLAPEGTFLMGSPVTEAERFGGPSAESHETRHRTRIDRSFAMSAHEVTIAQYEAFRDDITFNRLIAREDDAPANAMSWYRAAAYCNWLSEQEGIPRDQWCYDPDQEIDDGMPIAPDYLARTGYRLPTEAEWEYAARAGALTARYYGETPTLHPEYAWYSDTSLDRWMAPVGSLKPNDFGLFDVYGNAWEWCHDMAYRYPRIDELVVDEIESETVDSNRLRLLRGGAYGSTAADTRSAYRLGDQPENRAANHGFRLARTIVR